MAIGSPLRTMGRRGGGAGRGGASGTKGVTDCETWGRLMSHGKYQTIKGAAWLLMACGTHRGSVCKCVCVRGGGGYLVVGRR